jgi:hypothetical protein
MVAAARRPRLAKIRYVLQRLKNLQAVFTAGGVLVLFALYALAYRDLPAQVVDVIASAPAGIAWLPWSLPAMLIPGGATAIATGAGIALSAVGLTAAGVRLAEHLVRDGLIVGSGAYRGRRGRPPATPSGSRGWFRGIVGRELTLLRRDRNLFVTTLVVPILIIAFSS